MNVQILRQSRDFQQFMSRVSELGNDAAQLIKNENCLIGIGRLQGRMVAIDEITTLLDQIEAEQQHETGE